MQLMFYEIEDKRSHILKVINAVVAVIVVVVVVNAVVHFRKFNLRERARILIRFSPKILFKWNVNGKNTRLRASSHERILKHNFSNCQVYRSS